MTNILTSVKEILNYACEIAFLQKHYEGEYKAAKELLKPHVNATCKSMTCELGTISYSEKSSSQLDVIRLCEMVKNNEIDINLLAQNIKSIDVDKIEKTCPKIRECIRTGSPSEILTIKLSEDGANACATKFNIKK